MDIKKINKKGSSLTLTGVVLSLLVAIGFFVGYFAFFSEQLSRNSETLDDKYNDTYTQLLEITDNIDEDVNEIKESVDKIREADETYLAALNGFKALGSTLLLPISFISHSIDLSEAFLTDGDIIPPFYQTLLITGILVVILFLILALLKGDPKL